MAEIYGGVETGGTWCVCALGSAPDQIVALEQFPTTSPDETIERIGDFFHSHPRPAAIGIGSFGPIDLDRSSPTWGYVTTTPKPSWQRVPIGPTLRERLGVPIAFDTDTGAAGLAEQRWGAGRGLPSLCYLTVGTGIGGALIVDGQPWHGLVHPEVGHIRVPHDRARDPYPGVCPIHGDCWEGLASGPAIAGRWGSPGDQLPGDHPAWPLESEYLAVGILSIVLVASPHRVIVGGGVAERPDLLQRTSHGLRQLLAGYLEPPLLSDRIEEYVVAPELGDKAGVLGGIALAQGLDPRGT